MTIRFWTEQLNSRNIKKYSDLEIMAWLIAEKRTTLRNTTQLSKRLGKIFTNLMEQIKEEKKKKKKVDKHFFSRLLRY